MHITQRIRKKSSLEDMIDHILSNTKNASSKVLSLYLPDHETAQLLRHYIYKRDYSIENILKFNYCSKFFKKAYESDINAAFEKFYELFSLSYGLCFPKIRTSSS